MSRRIALAFLVPAAFLAGACALVIGIDRRPTGEVEAGALDGGCDHRRPPPKSGVDDDSPDLPGQLVVAVKSTLLGTKGFHQETLGFDLDKTCTCGKDDPDGSHPVCRASPTSCDLDEAGIDNALSSELSYAPTLESAGVGSFDVDIGCGRNGILLFLRGYNGRANDSDVNVYIVPSRGIEAPHAGEASTNCKDAGYVTYPPQWDGKDRWSTDARTIVAGGKDPITLPGKAYVTNWTLVVEVTESTPVQIPFGPLNAQLTDGFLVAEIEPLDAEGRTIKREEVTASRRAARVKLEGQIAGRIEVDRILQTVTLLQGANVGSLCADTQIFGFIKEGLCEIVDLPAKPSDEGNGTPCNAISAALAFRAEPAEIENAGPALPPPINPCDAGPPPTCN